MVVHNESAATPTCKGLREAVWALSHGAGESYCGQLHRELQATPAAATAAAASLAGSCSRSPNERRLTKASIVRARASVRTSLWSPPALSRCVLGAGSPAAAWRSLAGLLSTGAPGNTVWVKVRLRPQHVFYIKPSHNELKGSLQQILTRLYRVFPLMSMPCTHQLTANEHAERTCARVFLSALQTLWTATAVWPCTRRTPYA